MPMLVLMWMSLFCLVRVPLAGICNWLVAIPFDTIKSRIQTAGPGKYKGMLDCGKCVGAPCIAHYGHHTRPFANFQLGNPVHTG